MTIKTIHLNPSALRVLHAGMAHYNDQLVANLADLPKQASPARDRARADIGALCALEYCLTYNSTHAQGMFETVQRLAITAETLRAFKRSIAWASFVRVPGLDQRRVEEIVLDLQRQAGDERTRALHGELVQ